MTLDALYDRVRDQLRIDDCVALVTIKSARGSTPQKAGAAMMVTKEGAISGTIGGGALEYAAIQDATALLAKGNAGSYRRDYPLGPDLGQCCGGRVRLVTDVITSAEPDRLRTRLLPREEDAFTCLYLFGAGHVGRALTRAFATLPFAIRWIDQRRPGRGCSSLARLKIGRAHV